MSKVSVQSNGKVKQEVWHAQSMLLPSQRPPTPLRGGYYPDLLAPGTVTFVMPRAVQTLCQFGGRF